MLNFTEPMSNKGYFYLRISSGAMPSLFADYMANKITFRHSQVKEEMYRDNEMALNPTLALLISFGSIPNLSIT